MDTGSTTAQMNGADIIVDFLVRQNVPYLFGLCGHGNVGFLDAAFKAQNRIRTISVHHEQAAGHMADAYFKVRHEPVATFTSLRPGFRQPGGRAGRGDDGQLGVLRHHRQRADQPVQPRPVPGNRPLLPGRFSLRHPPVREAQLPADARRHDAAGGAPGLGPDAVRPARPGEPRRAAERVRGGGGGDAARRVAAAW